MCGRCRCSLDKNQSVEYAERTLQKDVRVDSTFEKHTPRYNISPGTALPVLVPGDGDCVVLRTAVWGLVPRSQKYRRLGDHYKMFNARSEELDAKPSFAGLVSRNRCVILTEGFYEWENKRVLGKEEKQPYYIYLPDANDKPAVMALAGLYDVWHPETAEELVTCTVLTTASDDTLRWLHDRMPVILHDDAAAAKWLDIENQKTITREMIQPHGGIKFHAVTQKMSKVSFDGTECVERLRPPTTMTKFFRPIKKRTKAVVADKDGDGDGDDDVT